MIIFRMSNGKDMYLNPSYIQYVDTREGQIVVGIYGGLELIGDKKLIPYDFAYKVALLLGRGVVDGSKNL